MRATRTTSIIILCLLIRVTGYSQSNDDLHQLTTVFDEHNHQNNYSQYVKSSKNELQFVYASLFLVYKETISSQDLNSCVFHPSCSVYSVQSIQKRGIIYGLFDSLDRITRCHPLAGLGSNYSYHAEMNKYYDPVE